MSQRHSLLLFFVLEIGISWLIQTPLWLSAIGVTSLPVLPFHHAFGALGPISSAFIATGIEPRQAGASNLFKHMDLWRGRLGWVFIIVTRLAIASRELQLMD